MQVSGNDHEWTDTQLMEAIEGLATQLQQAGVQRVASRLDNGPAWIALDLALRGMGAVHIPLPTFFSDGQLRHGLHSSGADCLILADGDVLPEAVSAGHRQPLSHGLSLLRLDAAPVALPTGTVCITYTSGTTGQPKGVCLDESALLGVATALADAASPLRPTRHLCLMPLSTLLENVAGVYAALIADASIAVPSLAEIGYSGASGLDIGKLLACLHRYQPESIILVPQLLLALVMAAEQGAPLPASLKFIAVGGGRIGTALLARAEHLRLPVFEGYGLTECASVVCLNRPGEQRQGSVGRPLPHARVSIIDGEIHVAGQTHLGYLGEPAVRPQTVATGDLGYIDDDGFVHIIGRRKNVFITAYGRNVSPEWVESELLQQPMFAQAVVIGEGRPYNVAVVWPRQRDAGVAQLRDALQSINAGLPDYARVRDVVLASEPFSAANGLLTSNGRPRRDAILARHAIAIDDCYRIGIDDPAIEGVLPA
ncbi:long-chain acyl-CoA synthetase [Pseudoxanthomonas dokdonensis]|uniref:Long-chain acyl-CoA synthetase n=1 Tax=Pseudoxanthomonas dokdonensis TaxID=344882 RepID=A0A0R0CSF1_9GAMM|nr:long-chain acyl-CoA synthetase [Pseudoxanthomonas dokdonensis]